MKTIGLIGGMSWESTLPYYRYLNELVRETLGGLHSAKIILYSVDFAEIEQLQRTGDWQTAGQQLRDIAEKLVAAGAELLVIGTNTMHKVADQVAEGLPIPLLHIADATAERIKAAGLQTIGLLGTRFTMEQDFYRGRLQQHGLHVIVPDADARNDIHRVIYEELCKGQIVEASRQRFQQVVVQLIEQGAEGIIFGCTEIGLLLSAKDCPVPSFDTTRIHAEYTVEAALRR
ncbi:aspartate/glutamate racemase family protein [Permianibacter aggregans]|uniref:Aspartate racemase n=1 Tax=Permianibacter aggregans TaxID=1510150 RepID=A0A4V3D7L7_9GAMM|nr:aspartate/glutamate racemase family protein [Permianibacter aggregans]QGX40751.1 aspartate/glutamate racemase family protein [Permianibacter aggregans]TDQ48437.1 aspartate racemase [Permianibacter aggregans]